MSDTFGSEPLVGIHLLVPRSFRDELHGAARANGLSLADLIRLVLRAFLRNRYTEAERELLA